MYRVSFILYLRKKYATDRHGTLYVRATCQRKHVYINLLETIDCKHWNAQRKQVRGSHPNAAMLNDLAQQKIAQLHAAILGHRLKGCTVDFFAVKDLLCETKPQSDGSEFAALVDRYCKVNGLKHGRIKQFGTTKTLWKKAGMPVQIAGLREKHLLALRERMQADGLAHNTQLSHLKRVRCIVSYAMALKMIDQDPMQFIRIGTWQSQVHWLNKQQVAALEQLQATIDGSLLPTLQLFLFACYTGLRFGDTVQLTWANVIDTDNGKALNYRQEKTARAHLLPLLPQAVALLPAVIGHKLINQVVNRQLKKIAAMAKISQLLTFHLARHTFASIGLNAGINLDTMQILMGHRNKQTTAMYAHIQESTLQREISKMDNSPAGG